MSLTITDIDAGLQKHLAANPTIFQEKMVMFEEEVEKLGVQIYNDVEDEMPLYRMDVTDPGQPGNRAAENIKSDVVKFDNRTLKVRDAEVSLKLTNQQINALYRTHLAQIRRSGARGSSYDVPFEDVIIDAVIRRFLDRLIALTSFKGAHNAAGTTSADIADGWETIVAADILSGDIPAGHVFTGAAITNTTALAQFHGVEDLVASQSPEYQEERLLVYAAPENVKYYRENYRSVHGSLPYNTEFKKNFVNDDTNRELVSARGLAGDDRIMITTPGNFAIGTDAMSRLSNIWTERRGRDLYIYLDGKMGMNYAISNEIWTNDQ